MSVESTTRANWQPVAEPKNQPGKVELLPEACDQDRLVTWCKSWSGEMDKGQPKIYIQTIYPGLNSCTCTCESLTYQTFKGTSQRSERCSGPNDEMMNRIWANGMKMNILCKHLEAAFQIQEVAEGCYNALLDGLDHWYELNRKAA